MTDKQVYKLLVAFNQRHQSLLSDGYRDIFTYFGKTFIHIKMQNAKGKVISLTVHKKTYCLIQRSNHKTVHKEYIFA